MLISVTNDPLNVKEIIKPSYRLREHPAAQNSLHLQKMLPLARHSYMNNGTLSRSLCNKRTLNISYLLISNHQRIIRQPPIWIVYFTYIRMLSRRGQNNYKQSPNLVPSLLKQCSMQIGVPWLSRTLILPANPCSFRRQLTPKFKVKTHLLTFLMRTSKFNKPDAKTMDFLLLI